MGRRSTFVAQMVEFCENDWYGYSQVDRWERDGDCSSFIYRAGYAAGYDLPRSGTRYTGTILDHFRAAGFTVQPFDGNVWDLDPGDVILNVGSHVEMCVMPGKFGGGHIDEHGNIAGGQPGDQTGNEVSIGPAYIYSGGWDWVLTPPDDDDEQQAEPEGVRYRCKSDDEWNAEMIGEHDTGGSNDTFGGQLGVDMTYLAVKGHRVRVMTKNSFPDWLPWIDKYNYTDEEFGCAGDGSAILLVQVEGCTVMTHRTKEWDGVVDAVTIK